MNNEPTATEETMKYNVITQVDQAETLERETGIGFPISGDALARVRNRLDELEVPC